MEEKKHSGTFRIGFGLILFLVGVAFLLEQLGLCSAETLLNLWPTAVMVFLLIRFAQNSHRAHSIFWLTFVLLIGVLMQLQVLELLNFHWHHLWPLILILIGLRLFWSSLHPTAQTENMQKSEESDQAQPVSTNQERLQELVVFGEKKRSVRSQTFGGGTVDTVFGNYQLDLRNATFANNALELRANAIFGNIEILVPDEWKVVSEGASLLGSFEDLTQPMAGSEEHLQKCLHLKGMALFGRVEVKNG